MPDWLGADPVHSYRAAADRAIDACTAPGVLDGNGVVPWGEMPAQMALNLPVLARQVKGTRRGHRTLIFQLQVGTCPVHVRDGCEHSPACCPRSRRLGIWSECQWVFA
jgi:hypothetical protein